MNAPNYLPPNLPSILKIFLQSILYPCRGDVTAGYLPKSKRNLAGEALNCPPICLATILKAPENQYLYPGVTLGCPYCWC
jgi:hypothetical protein